ncbi:MULTISPECIES: DUF4148 domain-containing protein [Paraburkholderia]|uniref:DUF4148 domain-containing protein n=1 Tax=Paraburkholderia TaxID=1822464 RepID=UPI00224E4F93|nr:MULTISPECIES: DUF4148 domain-containing protein [Paraburkholderia]MCX4170837.1 DUF4148 domain-containing protein [Paraburkholderia madseniana]MDQ6458849.1 DUF4148 domain-containing protein [Paraburkholderia madseniana]
MKFHLIAAAMACAASISCLAAEPSPQLTRAQVVSELEALHRAGYSPQEWVHYPDNIQAAERRVQAEHANGQLERKP